MKFPRLQSILPLIFIWNIAVSTSANNLTSLTTGGCNRTTTLPTEKVSNLTNVKTDITTSKNESAKARPELLIKNSNSSNIASNKINVTSMSTMEEPPKTTTTTTLSTTKKIEKNTSTTRENLRDFRVVAKSGSLYDKTSLPNDTEENQLKLNKSKAIPYSSPPSPKEKSNVTILAIEKSSTASPLVKENTNTSSINENAIVKTSFKKEKEKYKDKINSKLKVSSYSTNGSEDNPSKNQTFNNTTKEKSTPSLAKEEYNQTATLSSKVPSTTISSITKTTFPLIEENLKLTSETEKTSSTTDVIKEKFLSTSPLPIVKIDPTLLTTIKLNMMAVTAKKKPIVVNWEEDLPPWWQKYLKDCIKNTELSKITVEKTKEDEKTTTEEVNRTSVVSVDGSNDKESKSLEVKIEELAEGRSVNETLYPLVSSSNSSCHYNLTRK